MAGPITILFADEREGQRAALEAILTPPDYRVVQARSGAEALRVLLDQDVSLLLVEAVMPDMTGIEIASLVHGRDRTASIPIVLVTPRTADRAELDRGYAAGVVDVLTEPFVPELVRAKIGTLGQLVRMREQLVVQGERERELALLELQLASERRYRDLAESLPNIVWTARPDGSVDYFNQRWFEYTGISAERSAGSWRGALHPDDIDSCAQAWQHALATGELHETECRLRRADGSHRWHLCRAVPERGAAGEIVAWLGSFTDIDHERRAREVLAELKGMLDAVLDAVMIFDTRDWRLLYVNQGASALLGYSREELLGMRPLDFTADHDEAATRELLAPLVTGERATLTVEIRLRRSDGRTVPVEVSLQLIRVDGGRVVWIARDITERERVRLERELLYRETVDALRARDEFMSIASHELRTPLFALQLQIEMLLSPPGRDPTAVPTPEQLHKKLQLAARQVDRLARLISELLDVSRITGHRLRLERERADFAAIAREVVERFAEDAARAHCTVTLDAREPVVGTWDRLRLEQVLTNLLTNAFKFGAGKPIEVAVVQDGTLARLTVTDHGIGIAAEDVDRIFHRFEQAVSSRAYGGLGLGLYIVRGIVEAHGGTVRVDSRPELGSTFTIELPLQAEAAEPAEPDATAEDLRTGNRDETLSS